jgi:hypothetical protein
MQLALTAKNTADGVRSSLSYINGLVTNAIANNKFLIIVDAIYIDDTMMNALITTYGYKVEKRFFDIGTYPQYVISWESATIPASPTPTPSITPSNTPASTPTPTPTPTASSTHVAGVDFTIEWWMKVTNWTSPTYHPRPYSLGTAPAPNAVSIEGGGDHIYWWTGGGYQVDFAGLGLQNNTWYHFAVTRNNGQLAIYVNGQRKATSTYNNAIPSAGNALMIGAEPNGSGAQSNVNGLMTNYRWNSSVKYTGTSFTVPTSPLTADSNTKFLMLATNSGGLTTDSSTFARTITNHGATWSSDSPFVSGGGSVNFAGTGYFTVPASSDWDL